MRPTNRKPRTRGKLKGPVSAPVAMHSRGENALKATVILVHHDLLAGFYPSAHILAGTSIELSLKAFLSLKADPTSVPRDQARLGHNLIRMLAMARDLALHEPVRIGIQARRLLRWLNRFHHGTRYYTQTVSGSSGYEAPPPILPVTRLADKLSKGTRAACYPPRKPA